MRILPARSPTARELVARRSLALSLGSPLREVSVIFSNPACSRQRSQRRKTRERNVHSLDRNYDGIIIGAGHHGLVLGAYLAKAGLDILVVERRLDYGGGLCTKEATEPGFYHNLHSINHF